MVHFKKATGSLFHVYEAIKIKLHFLKLKSFFKAKVPGTDSEGIIFIDTLPLFIA